MEKQLQKKAIDYIKQLGLMCFAINPPNYKHMVYGTLFNLPDIFIVDFPIFIELKDKQYNKAHKERQEKQKQRRKELTAHNIVAYKADTFEKVKTIIDFWQNKKCMNVHNRF